MRLLLLIKRTCCALVAMVLRRLANFSHSGLVCGACSDPDVLGSQFFPYVEFRWEFYVPNVPPSHKDLLLNLRFVLPPTEERERNKANQHIPPGRDVLHSGGVKMFWTHPRKGTTLRVGEPQTVMQRTISVSLDVGSAMDDGRSLTSS